MTLPRVALHRRPSGFLGVAQAVAVMLSLATGVRPLGADPHFTVPGRVDAGPHPRSLLLPEDLEGLRARAGREPYRTLVERIHGRAMEEHDPADDTVRTGHYRANTARSAALLCYLDLTLDPGGQVVPFPDPAARRAMGERALAQLLTMNTRSYAKGLLDATLDIHTAQELHLWADTLDLLLGADEDLLGAERDAAVQRVADLAADFYADYCLTNWVMLRSETANHRSKSAGALGVAAIVLNGEVFDDPAGDGRYDPAAWIDFGHRWTDLVVRDLQTDADGGFQEGPGYLFYSGINHWPFLWAWHRYAGGAGFSLPWDEPVPPYYALHAAGTYLLPDLWADPWQGRQLDYLVRLMLPDATLPALDDNSPGGRFAFGPFIRPEFPNAGLYRWAWERMGRPSEGCVDTTPLTLVAHDDSIPARSPESLGWSLHQVLPYAGQLLFRSDWGPDAVAALLLAEHGRAAGWTQSRWGDFVDGAAGHEHPDGASFALWAYGEALALDPGYMGWEEHAVVHRPEHHNLLLVDGQGADIHRFTVPGFVFDEDMNIVLTEPLLEGGYAPARDGMAYLVRWDVETPGVAYGEIATRYFENVPDTEIRRRATFLSDRFLVLHDTAIPLVGGADHDFTFQLHGHGGGTSGGVFQADAEGGAWTRGRARLTARVTSDRPVTITTREGIHDPGWRVPLTHTVLDATVRGPEARFLALLAPEPVPAGDATLLEATVDACEGAGPCMSWATPRETCFAWSGFDHEARLHPGSPTLLRAGWGAYCRSDEALQGTFGDFDEDEALLFTARFSRDPGGELAGWEATLLGHGWATRRGSLTLPLPAGLHVAGACDVTSLGERVRVEAPLGARLRTQAQAPQASPFPARIALDGAPPGAPLVLPLGDEALLDTAGTCPPNAADLRITWALTQRPELSRVSLPAGPRPEPTLSFLPDLPGLYRVQALFASEDATGEARIAFEVEGEVPWPDAGPADAGPADAGDATPLGRCGCSCETAGRGDAAPALLLIVFGLIPAWRRSRRRPSPA